MGKTIEELKTSGYLDKAPVYIEATNHYEALLANTLADAASFAVNANGPLWILPDTYHMNIEEKDIYAPLQKHQDYITISICLIITGIIPALVP